MRSRHMVGRLVTEALWHDLGALEGEGRCGWLLRGCCGGERGAQCSAVCRGSSLAAKLLGTTQGEGVSGGLGLAVARCGSLRRSLAH